MLSVKRDTLTRCAYFDIWTGRRCMLGHVFHANGVPDSVLVNGEGINTSAAEISRFLGAGGKVETTLLSFSNSGYRTLSHLAKVVTQLNDEGMFDEAAALLNDYGIEVELVD